MDNSVIFFLAAIFIVCGLVLGLIFLTRRGTKHLDVEKYRSKCLEIEHQLSRDNPATYQLSILNADKLVDQALRDLNIKGQTMGERLKCATPSLSDANGIWTAHKLRNKIAHESDMKVTYEQARYALVQFRKALKDLGAI